MSKIFISFAGPETRYLYTMGNDSARLFVLLANATAHFYGLEDAISSKTFSDEYIVDEENFCKLVEAIFAFQRIELYEWSQYAAPLYESIKKERYDWIWNTKPKRPFVPVRMQGYSPELHSGKSIGPVKPQNKCKQDTLYNWDR